MRKLIELPKNFILATGGIVVLLVSVYVGSLFFLAAVLVEEVLKATHSQYTLDELLHNMEYNIKMRKEYYRNNWDNFHFKNLRLPF